MTNVISSTKTPNTVVLSKQQTAFKKQHYQTMLDFAKKFVSGDQQASTIVDACFTKLFKENTALPDPVGAMIRLFEIVEDQCRNPVHTGDVSQQRKLLPVLTKSA